MKKIYFFLCMIAMSLIIFSGCDKSDDTPASDKCGSMTTRETIHSYGDLFTDSIYAGLPYSIIYSYNPIKHITTINFQSIYMGDVCCYSDSLFSAQNIILFSNIDATVSLNFLKISVNGTWHNISQGYNLMYDTTFATKPLNSAGPAKVAVLWSFSFPSQTTRHADYIYLANRVNWSISMKYPLFIGK